ncbi:MAG: hypothetical protein ACKOXI_00785 [Candidatus Planktophila sp.]
MKKLTRKQWILVGVVAVVALSILRSVTNGGSDLPKDKTTLVEETAPVATIAFDTPLDLGGGVFVTVAAPTRFTPSQFMTNIDQKPKVANRFNVTIKNGGATPLDFATVALIADSGSNVCFDVLGDLDINGAPTEPLAPGATATYAYGVGCQADSGDPLSLTVQIGESKVAVEGKIA